MDINVFIQRHDETKNMNNNYIQASNSIPELQSPFEQLREVDADGKEWWNSRKLARVMGYGKYWNFERVWQRLRLG